ncbi:MAG: hypothetical protein EBV16_03805, partial [Betaproteobacteria bacterium]|nr:hypothetical protein [Betaproteobacteria bacterium]
MLIESGYVMNLQKCIDDLATLVAFSAASVAAAILFARFGFLYAGVAAVVCAPLVIFDLEQSDTLRRIVACAVMLTCALVARAR